MYILTLKINQSPRICCVFIIILYIHVLQECCNVNRYRASYFKSEPQEPHKAQTNYFQNWQVI